MSEKEKTPEEKLKDMEKSRDSWKTWGIISIIGAVFCFIVCLCRRCGDWVNSWRSSWINSVFSKCG